MTKMPPTTCDSLLPSGNERVATRCVCCAGDRILRSPAVLMPFIADRIFHWTPVSIDPSWGLKTIANGQAYSICNTLYCEKCGFVFLDLRFSDKELARLYANYRDDAYVNLRDYYEPGYRERNQVLQVGNVYIRDVEAFLEPVLKLPVKLLDWGGDTGKNTPFKTCQTVFDIYDISDKMPVFGARRVTKTEVQSTVYDLIVCSNVLEHVPYPASLLGEICACMGEQTILYLEVPLEEIMKAPFTGFHRNKRHWHEHINFFSQAALQKLLEACRLNVIAQKILDVETEGRAASLFQFACRLASAPPEA